MANAYRGFSTFGAKKHFQLTDRELVNRDLMNHIYTLRGERVMMPAFGTSIPLLAFEPLDKKTLDVVESDLRDVINYDPRVKLLAIAVRALPDNNAIVAVVDLQYIELDVVDSLHLEFPVGG